MLDELSEARLLDWSRGSVALAAVVLAVATLGAVLIARLTRVRAPVPR